MHFSILLLRNIKLNLSQQRTQMSGDISNIAPPQKSDEVTLRSDDFIMKLYQKSADYDNN